MTGLIYTLKTTNMKYLLTSAILNVNVLGSGNEFLLIVHGE